MQGGCDLVFECVGAEKTTDDAVRLTRSGGTVVMVSSPVVPKSVDWTAIQVQELKVEGSMYYDHAVNHQGHTGTTFELALELMASGKTDLGWMVTHRFPLARYAQAFDTLGRRDRHSVIKAVFEFDA